MENRHILLKEFLQNDFAVSTELGEKLFLKIKSHLDKGEKVDVDFDGIIVVITAFLNASIGAIYNNLYTEEFIKTHISFSNLSDTNKTYLDLVVDNAKKYFSNEAGFNKNIDDLLNGEN